MEQTGAGLQPGKYVVAVSGGVDSMVLLDMLSRQPQLELVVAHFNHGIRGAAADRDEALVAERARHYNLPYTSDRAMLGTTASEADARVSRYEFLLRAKRESQARAIVLAHHQDDIIETMLINLIRGTGWRGLCSLRTHEIIVRPLLQYDKAAIRSYAHEHHIKWREDQTNRDEHYLRNHIRHTLLPQLMRRDPTIKSKLLDLYHKQIQLEADITAELARWYTAHVAKEINGLTLSRYDLIMLPSEVAIEVLQQVSLDLTGKRLLHSQVMAAVQFAKVARPGALMRPGGGLGLLAHRRHLIAALRPK